MNTEKKQNELEYFKLGSTLKELRRKQNLTQVELTNRSGLKQSNYSRIEANKTLPHLPTLRKIAKALGYKVEINFKKVRKED